jgi:Flp pilus assembly protein TadB
MDLGSPGHQDLLYAQLQAETLARKAQALAQGEVLPEDPPDSRGVSVLKTLVSSFIVLLIVGGVIWLYGGPPEAVIAGVAVTLVALALISRWQKSRSE